MESAFVILDFRDPEEDPAVVYLETPNSAAYLQKQADIQRYATILDTSSAKPFQSWSTYDRQQLRYRKSTRSGGSGGNCVEWAHGPGTVYIRDSKNPDGLVLTATHAEWSTFLTAASEELQHPWVRRTSVDVQVCKDSQVLTFTHAEWSAFVEGVHAGECLPDAA